MLSKFRCQFIFFDFYKITLYFHEIIKLKRKIRRFDENVTLCADKSPKRILYARTFADSLRNFSKFRIDNGIVSILALLKSIALLDICWTFYARL